jgi:hypothetical protein
VHIILAAGDFLGESCQRDLYLGGFEKQTLCQRHSIRICYQILKESSKTAGIHLQSVWFLYIDVYLYPRLPQYTRATRLLLFRRGDYRVYPAINVSSSQIRYYGHLTAQPTLKRSECVASCTSYDHRLCYGIPTDAPVNMHNTNVTRRSEADQKHFLVWLMLPMPLPEGKAVKLEALLLTRIAVINRLCSSQD